MRVHVTSRTEIPNVIPPDGAILISITDPDSMHPRVSKDWKAVLRQKFHDIEYCWFGNEVLFSADQAAEILDFVREYNPRVVWANCDAGVSRSAGVAVALDKILSGVDSRNLYPYYNKHVAQTLLEVFESREE